MEEPIEYNKEKRLEQIKNSNVLGSLETFLNNSIGQYSKLSYEIEQEDIDIWVGFTYNYRFILYVYFVYDYTLDKICFEISEDVWVNIDDVNAKEDFYALLLLESLGVFCG